MDTLQRFFEEICRLCLKKDILTPLFNENDILDYSCVDSPRFVAKFADLKISKGDGLPQSVCQMCLEWVKVAINFQRKCVTSDGKLRRAVSRLRREAILFQEYFPDVEPHSESDPDSIWDEDCTKVNNVVNDSDSSTTIDVADPSHFEACIFKKHFPDVDLSEDISGKPSPTKKWSPAPPGYDRRGRPRTKRTADQDLPPSRMTKKEQKEARKVIVEAIKLKRLINKPNKRKRRNAKYLEALDGTYTAEGPVNCKICGKRLSNLQSLRLHSQMHFGFNFICELCGKGCRSYAALDQHFMTRHGRERRLPCAQCDYRAINRVELRVHERTHTGERPFVCDVCGTSFHRRFCLVAHIKRHSNRKYKCDRCPKSYVESSGLKSHINSMHDRQYAYKCHLCDYQYARTMSVRKHLEEQHGLPRENQGHIKRISLL